MRHLSFLAVCLVLVSTTITVAKEPAAKPKVLTHKMKTLEGKAVDLAKKYQGKVVLFVNVASQCGLTSQYEGLQALHDKYGKTGLAVVGVPCNQFGGQEPGTAAEIRQFCTDNYNVKFDMLAKVDVNGENACGLYKYLTGLDLKPEGKGKVRWNFEKFLVNRKGEVVGRFSPQTSPDDPALVKTIQAELEKK